MRYKRLSKLLLELTQEKADGGYQKLLLRLAKSQVLSLDDWRLEKLTATHRNDLLETMDDRHDTTSTVRISQLPKDEWHDAICDNTLEDAILDRLMHKPHRLSLKGESMRNILGKLTEGEHLTEKSRYVMRRAIRCSRSPEYAVLY